MLPIIETLFNDYLRLISQNADAPQLTDIDRRLHESHHSILVSNQIALDPESDEKEYTFFSATIVLLNEMGGIAREVHNHRIKVFTEYQSERKDGAGASQPYDEFDRVWLEGHELTFEISPEALQYLTNYDTALQITTSIAPPKVVD